MDYDAAQRTAKLKEFGDIQGKRTGLVDIDRANVKNAIDAGAGLAKLGMEAKSKALTAAGSSADAERRADVDVYQTQMGSRDKSLDRDVERLKAQVNADATRALREGQSQEKARTFYAVNLNKLERLERDYEKDFAAGPLGMLLMQDPAKLSPQDKNRLEIGRLELEQKKAKLRKEMQPIIDDAVQKLGGTSTAGWGDLKKAESKK